jgi:hypothetical protein
MRTKNPKEIEIVEFILLFLLDEDYMRLKVVGSVLRLSG